MAPERDASAQPAEDQEDKPRITVVDRRHWAVESDDDGDESPRKPSYVEELEEAAFRRPWSLDPADPPAPGKNNI